MSPTDLDRLNNSQRTIARGLGVSRARVRQLIAGEISGADRLHDQFLASAGTAHLKRYERALVARVRRDLALLRAARSEIESRRIDEINGLGTAHRSGRS